MTRDRPSHRAYCSGLHASARLRETSAIPPELPGRLLLTLNAWEDNWADFKVGRERTGSVQGLMILSGA